MPMKSQAQRRFWWATDPATARKWEDHTPKGTKLPEKVKKAFADMSVEVLAGLAAKHRPTR